MGGHFHRESDTRLALVSTEMRQNSLVLEAPLAVDDNVWCLASIEVTGHFSMGFLTLVTAAGCLALAGRGTAATADALVVGACIVRERREDGRVSLLLLLGAADEGEQQRCHRRVRRLLHHRPEEGRP